MEVHHHSKHGKKKFTEYLLEGLMIFVAVTLGFFAESLREHYINAEKVHASMQSMIRNLEYDSIRCSVNLEANLATCAGLDSLRYELDIAIQHKGSPDRIYYLTRKYAGANRAVFNEQAITELKNSGTLRLVKNDSLMNEITDYYERRVGAANRYSDAMTDA
ncbi:MAG: hypothetical protein JWN76_1061, partial [Chitinophagaceae bacterium]|nr:hypothetical protein [Chitinophagaceae bacterium]